MNCKIHVTNFNLFNNVQLRQTFFSVLLLNEILEDKLKHYKTLYLLCWVKKNSLFFQVIKIKVWLSFSTLLGLFVKMQKLHIIWEMFLEVMFNNASIFEKTTLKMILFIDFKKLKWFIEKIDKSNCVFYFARIVSFRHNSKKPKKVYILCIIHLSWSHVYTCIQ